MYFKESYESAPFVNTIDQSSFNIDQGIQNTHVI